MARVHPTSVPVVLANEEAPSLGGEEEEEEDIDLSDLDDDELEEYIFTQEEVRVVCLPAPIAKAMEITLCVRTCV